MPSPLHEALIELFRHRPSLAGELLQEPLGLTLPDWHKARLDSGELPDLRPTEFRADAVVTLSNGDGPVATVVIEVQLRWDARKRRSWPAYVANLHARLGCPSMLLVISPGWATAAACGAPIALGHPGFVLRPLVVGPEQVPVVTSPGEAGRSPELAVLSAVAHGGRPDADKIFEAMLAGLENIDHDHADLYADVVLAALPAAVRDHLERLMKTDTYQYQSDFARRYFGRGKAEGRAEGKAEGKAEGEAHALLSVCAARGIDVPEDAQARITGCTDLDLLEIWIGRAATATSIDEVL